MFKLFLAGILSLPLWISAAPTTFTQDVNAKVKQSLPFDQVQDFEDAKRGFIAPLPDNGIIKDDKGNVVWDLTKYSFLKEEKAPDSVNPSLWRQGRLLYEAGLYKVVDRIYQVRGADLSNMTIIEGNDGLIVIDPLISNETAKAALDLYFQHRPKKPIKAVIYTHSHIDHYGGVKGIITQEEVNSGKVKVIAPEGFTEAAIDENVMAGNAMARRATYMYGNLIPQGPEGQATSGLGLTVSTGKTSLILPTDTVTKTGQDMVIDGLKFEFVFAPDSEAPAEMLFFIPELKALDAAEDATHNMHNLYTLRGAKVRDARAWAQYLNEAIDLFGSQIEVVFAQHHWPVWGHDKAIDFLEKQRDMYKYLHDQTLHLANQGYTMIEIAEILKLPKSLDQEWYNRGYYGTVNHNAKAVYNFYLGWFDGNPSTLHQLPPVEASKKYVEYIGGSDAVLKKARQDFDKGNYRWTAQVLNHVVFAEPHNTEAKKLLADTLEQLGYQSESGPWRNFYLTGAKELREGVQKLPVPSTASPDVLSAMPTDLILDYFAIRLNGPKAAENPVEFNFNLPEKNEKFIVQIKNGVLNYFKGRNSDKAAFTITLNRSDFNDIILKKANAEELLKERKLRIEGNKESLGTLMGLFDEFDFWFNIVEPNNAK